MTSEAAFAGYAEAIASAEAVAARMPANDPLRMAAMIFAEALQLRMDRAGYRPPTTVVGNVVAFPTRYKPAPVSTPTYGVFRTDPEAVARQAERQARKEATLETYRGVDLAPMTKHCLARNGVTFEEAMTLTAEELRERCATLGPASFAKLRALAEV